MRDYLVLLVVFSLLPFGFRRPFFGLLLFNWLAYMRPHDLCWGIAKSFRLSFISGAALIFGFAAFEMGRRPLARLDIRTIAMIVILLTTALSTALAERQDEYVTNGLIEFTKIIFVSLLTTSLVDSRERLRYLNWCVAGGLAFYGVKNGLTAGILRGGASILQGPGGMMKDNNDFALALVMAVPMIWYMGQGETNKWVRRASVIAVILTCITIILTHSRGGFLSMSSGLFLIAFRSGNLVKSGLAVLVAGVLFLNFAPDSVIDRLATIEDAAEGNEDSSVAGRFRAWEIGARMIEHNPIVGVGHKNFRDHYQRHAYVLYPGEEHFNHVAHNSWIQMWAETGTHSFALFVGMMVSAFLAARRLRKMAKLRPDMAWCRNYGNMIEATTLAFMIGGTFLNRAHFDLIWHWMAVTTATLLIAKAQLRQTEDVIVEDPGTTGVRPARSAQPRSGGLARPATVWSRTVG